MRFGTNEELVMSLFKIHRGAARNGSNLKSQNKAKSCLTAKQFEIFGN